MTVLSRVREAFPRLSGLKLVHRGKVRDTYDLGGGFLLIVASDAISIFDFVLNAAVPQKGAVLTALSHFWFSYLESLGFKTHLVAAGAGIDPYLPEHLRGRSGLQKRAMVVRKLAMFPIEFVGRICLTGSAFVSYRERGAVFGYEVPAGLQDGDELAAMLFTPTSKSESGHDLPLDWGEVTATYPQAVGIFRGAYRQMAAFAESRDIIVADTKAELGIDEDGTIRIGDEFGTPDSSRFWSAIEWKASRRKAERKAPSPFDKQLVRAWGIDRGIPSCSPEEMPDVAWVQSLTVPADLLRETAGKYQTIFAYLAGKCLHDYEEQVLRIGTPIAA